tara:strand:- start:54331 stop:54534 length:204 start_codon:yes stop_codon:yes gene_type:complete
MEFTTFPCQELLCLREFWIMFRLLLAATLWRRNQVALSEFLKGAALTIFSMAHDRLFNKLEFIHDPT